MIACLIGASPRLKELASQFSPVVEQVSDDTVVFAVDGLRSLFGDLRQVAAEISRRGTQLEINANLAIAINKATAMLAACHRPGITLIEPGKEAEALADIPVEALLAPPEMFATFLRWGIHKLGDLAALPEAGIAERLGEMGVKFRRLALGQGGDIISLVRAAPSYTCKREMDDAIEQMEPLLFVVSAHLHDLTAKLQRNGRAAGGVSLTLILDNKQSFNRTITLPLATRDPLVLLKQLQLSLEANAPDTGILIVQTTLILADPRVIQGGLFRPATPEPDKLQTLIARLGALAGKDKVGSPLILNTHRPDAFEIRPCAFLSSDPRPSTNAPLRISFRHFRPHIEARVTSRSNLPLRIVSQRVTGDVLHAAGPWRTSGGIWAASSWERDEWDIVLQDQAIYRIYLTPGRRWFLCGSYD